MNETRGYQLIEPNLGLPELALDPDAQVRCLSYLKQQIPDLIPVPAGVLFELIPAQYLGGPYPAIGLYTAAGVHTASEMACLAFQIMDLLEDQIQQLGHRRLLELSQNEAICWQDVLGPHEEALRSCQDDWQY
jgi:hypothetical protein